MSAIANFGMQEIGARTEDTLFRAANTATYLKNTSYVWHQNDWKLSEPATTVAAIKPR